MHTHKSKNNESQPSHENTSGRPNQGSSLANLVNQRPEASKQAQLKMLAEDRGKESKINGLDALANGATGAKNPIQRMLSVIQLQGKPNVTGNSKDSVKLGNLVNALFKAAPADGVTVGDGSALAACNQEANGGDQVGGADHIEKCTQVLNGIQKLITRQANQQVVQNGDQLSDEDLAIAQALVSDLNDALGGNYNG